MELTDPAHFKTTDKQLALALATAGCRFAPQEDGGPAQNLYTPDLLRSRGMLPQNGVGVQRFEHAVGQAVSKLIPGAVSYLFIRDAVFERSIKAWDEMVKEFATADKDGREPEVPTISEEDVMRVLYMRRVNEKKCERVPFYNSPLLSITKSKTDHHPLPNRTPGVSETNAPGTRDVTTGSGKIWSLNLNQQARKELKIG